MYAFLLAAHALAAALWIGSVFFAYVVLRVTAPPEPAARLALWSRSLSRFFVFVWLFVIALLVSGYAMLENGGPRTWPIWTMQGVGWAMFAIFCTLALHHLPSLRRAVDAGDWPAAGATMARMRPLMAIVLVSGIVLIVLGTIARYLA